MASDRTKNFVQPTIPRIDGHYDHWSMLMENFLRSKEYLQVVDSGVAEPTEGIVLTNAQKTELEGQRLKDLKAKNYRSSRVKRALLQALRNDFKTLQMKDGESVTDYCARAMEIANKIITTYEQALKASTFAESTNFRGRGRGRGRERGAQGHRDRSRQYQSFKSDDDQSNFSGKGRGRDKQFDKSKVECYRCHKLGHYRSDCYVRMAKDKERWEKSNFAEKKEVETLLMAYHVKEEPPESDIRYVDTGCSNHMCGSKGDIQIKTRNGYVETISNVFYVPDLKSNLLSASQLQEKGYLITIQKGACEIYDPSRGAIAVDIPVSFNEAEDLFVPQIQSSDADHSIDQQLQTSDEILTADHLIID
ncbi:hypothetical protein JRO89_XS04G0051600 [Xanthoceras sorbifolium]|uniref:CCHC-type domain-containing protein n=1 Tax=Xanthoceras sorbifolium TaxID=99658 RepID=A0ABQ8I465_9ROSI|nr:hypothetical protein JRO89_XS04G0051600 [Xanthoceras sorbifolium]